MKQGNSDLQRRVAAVARKRGCSERPFVGSWHHLGLQEAAVVLVRSLKAYDLHLPLHPSSIALSLARMLSKVAAWTTGQMGRMAS